jgi:hypothetical protein
MAEEGRVFHGRGLAFARVRLLDHSASVSDQPAETGVLRMGKLERDLGRLEGIVDSLVHAIAEDRRNMAEQRKDLISFVQDTNNQSMKIVDRLSGEISKLVEEDMRSSRERSKARGQWDLSRYALALAITLAGPWLSYEFARRGAIRAANEMSSAEVRQQARP